MKSNEEFPLVNLLLATIRPARDVERRFCFEVVSPSENFVFQAENETNLNHWISVGTFSIFVLSMDLVTIPIHFR